MAVGPGFEAVAGRLLSVGVSAARPGLGACGCLPGEGLRLEPPGRPAGG